MAKNKEKNQKSNSAKQINEEQFRNLVRKMIYEQMEDMGDPLDVDMNQQVPEEDEGEEEIYLGTEKKKTKSQEESLKEESSKKKETGGRTSVGDPMDQEMNRMDQEGSKSAQGKSHGDASKTKGRASAGYTNDQKMNTRDSEQGSDAEAAVAVGVEAQDSSYSDDYKKGMNKATMYSKKGMNDETNEMGGEETGEPHYDIEMNSQDREVGDEKAKAYFEPGGDMKNGYNAGQKQPKFYEDPKNEEDPYGRIAKGVQISEAFNEKSSLKKSELEDLIDDQAEKVIQKLQEERASKNSEEKDKKKRPIKESNSQNQYKYVIRTYSGEELTNEEPVWLDHPNLSTYDDEVPFSLGSNQELVFINDDSINENKSSIQEEKKKEIDLPNSNLLFRGFGKDKNGNTIIKLSFPNEKGFSIQTQQSSLLDIHKLRSYSIDDLTKEQIKDIRDAVVEYLENHGSKKQKEKLNEADNYYKKQLDKLNSDSEYPISAKITGGEGETTKNINLNKQSVPVLINWMENNVLKEETEYYKKELNKINLDSEYPPSIKITDGEKNSTKNLNLNKESIPVIVNWLKNNLL